ncbi:hypothetical protein EDD21DRAFT_74673 [Dissophora ornata]|nr:hypothetical protein EDD21DRAFT_74673 [Dissophora ornata]
MGLTNLPTCWRLSFVGYVRCEITCRRVGLLPSPCKVSFLRKRPLYGSIVTATALSPSPFYTGRTCTSNYSQHRERSGLLTTAMTHSEKACTEANVGKGGIAERASNSKLEWREYLQGVQAEIYFENCRTIPDFRYLDFLDYMATEEKENCTLKRCQSAWLESIRKLSTSQHAGLKQKGESLLREWKCKLHSDAEALF